MRKLKIQSSNVEVSVSDWSTYINDKSITDLIHQNIEKGNFRAKITLTIEELENDLLIEGTGNKENEEYDIEE